MAVGDRIYLADKETLDKVHSRVNLLGTKVGVDKINYGLALPYPFQYGAVLHYRGEIHLIGGLDYTKNHYKFNGTSWVKMPDLPVDFMRGSAVVYEDEIHLLGGTGTSTHNTHLKFNGDSWITLSNLPYTFSNGSAIVFREKIHIVGGSNSSTSHYSYDGSSWSMVVNPVPFSSISGNLLIYNNMINHIGGSSTSSMWYRFDGTKWETVAQFGMQLDGVAIVSKGDIHIFGSGTTYKQHNVIRAGSSTVHSYSELSETHQRGYVLEIDGVLHLIGGVTTLNKHTKYFSRGNWSSNDALVSTKYYLQKGNIILCDPSRTLISKGSVETIDEGYLVTESGVVEISYTDEESKCYQII